MTEQCSGVHADGGDVWTEIMKQAGLPDSTLDMLKFLWEIQQTFIFLLCFLYFVGHVEKRNGMFHKDHEMSISH